MINLSHSKKITRKESKDAPRNKRYTDTEINKIIKDTELIECTGDLFMIKKKGSK